MAEPRNLTPEMVEAFDLCPTVILVFEIGGFQIVAANAAAVEKYGYSRDDITAMTLMDLLSPEEVLRLTILASRMIDGTDAAGRARHLTKGGDDFIADITSRVVEMNGQLCKLAVIHDVTQQAALEEVARARMKEATARERAATVIQRHFAELFNLAPGHCAILRPESFEVVAVSDGYLEAVGMQRAEVIGQPLLDLVAGPSEDREAGESEPLGASLRQVVETGRATFLENTGLTFYVKNIAPRDAETSSCVVVNMPLKGPDDSMSFVLHSLSLADAAADAAAEDDDGDDDIADADKGDASGALDLSPFGILRHLQAALSSQKTMALARQLAESEALLRTTERLLHVHVWRFDVDNQQLEWTDELFALFGLPVNAKAPTFDEYVAMVHPDDRENMIANYTAFAESVDRDFNFAHRIVRPDRQVIHVKGAAERVIENNRNMLSGVVQDVTEVAEARAKAERRDYLMRMAARIGGIGGWRVDLDSQISDWSEETARIHEAPETRQVGLQRAISFYPPEYRDRITERFNACAEQGTPFDEVLQIVTAQDNRVWIRAVGEAERDVGGRIVAVRGAFQDLSEVVRIDEEHRALRNRLSRTLESMTDAFFTLDSKWRFTYLNQKCESLLRRKRDELLGKIVWSEFPEAVGSRFETEYRHAVETGESVEFTEYYPPLDLWLRVTAHPSPDGLAVYFRDVTRDRIRDQNMRMLNAAITRMDDIVLITEAAPVDPPDGPRIIYVNDAFTRLTGYTAEEAIGRTPHFLQGPETQRSELDRIRTALKQNQPVRAEVINYGKDRSKYWLEMDITPLVDAAGKTTHFVALERDMTERRKWEENLRLSEERFRLVTNASKDVVWDWDVRTGALWWSDKLSTVFGHDIGTTPALATDVTACVHPDDVEKVGDELFRLVESKRNLWQEEYRFLRADGRIAYIRDRAFVLRDKNGKATRVIGSMVDVTQKREQEAIVRQTQKLDAIGQLTGGVAHDFNNLLTVMLNNGDFLAERLADRDDLRILAEQVVGAAERGAALTSRLLAFARQQPLSPEVTSLNVATRSIEPLLRRSLGEVVEIEMVLSQIKPRGEALGAHQARKIDAAQRALGLADHRLRGGVLRLAKRNRSGFDFLALGAQLRAEVAKLAQPAGVVAVSFRGGFPAGGQLRYHVGHVAASVPRRVASATAPCRA